MKQLCPAKTKTGKPCKAMYLFDGTYCRFHSPENKQSRIEAARLGGKSHVGTRLNMKNFKLRSSKDLLFFYRTVMEQLARGNIELTAAYIKHLPQYSKEYREIIREVELEKRIDEALKTEQ